MALFGLFGNKSEGSALKKHIDRATNKRAQAIDRWEAIQVLVKAGNEEAIAGLLPRFGFYVDPSITDQDEKDAAFAGIVAAGSVAVGPVKAYLQKAESIAWPVKLLDALCPPADVVDSLLNMLAGMDTEYERDPQRKIDLIAALGERQGPKIVSVVERFLEDANETARFSAVGTILAQDNAADGLPALVGCLGDEESVRVRNRIVEGLAELELAIPTDLQPTVKAQMGRAFKLDASGILRSA